MIYAHLGRILMMWSCLLVVQLPKALLKANTLPLVDLTRGELGSRGTAETRAKESAAAQQILGVPTS